eukprot:9862289-Alexandrium_andersonii.AAC.1
MLVRGPCVPLGLDVRGEHTGACLVVGAVREGVAFEAWNRQLAGDVRGVRAGDLIVEINGAVDPHAMREQFLAQPLLHVT